MQNELNIEGTKVYESEEKIYIYFVLEVDEYLIYF